MGNYLLVDGNSATHRAYHAKKHSGRIGTTGEELLRATIQGAAGMISAVRSVLPNPQTFIAFDGGGDALGRYRDYPQYKAKRVRDENDRAIIRAAIEGVQERYREVENVSCLVVAGYEADDVLATLAHSCDLVGDRAVIYSSDNDMLQCLTENVSVRQQATGGGTNAITAESYARIKGYSHRMIPTWKALAGDESDNIGGVPKVGPTHAERLIKEYGDLDGIYANVQAIKTKSVRNKLVEHRDLAYLCLRVGTVYREVPVGAAMIGAAASTQYRLL